MVVEIYNRVDLAIFWCSYLEGKYGKKRICLLVYIIYKIHGDSNKNIYNYTVDFAHFLLLMFWKIIHMTRKLFYLLVYLNVYQIGKQWFGLIYQLNPFTRYFERSCSVCNAFFKG